MDKQLAIKRLNELFVEKKIEKEDWKMPQRFLESRLRWSYERIEFM